VTTTYGAGGTTYADLFGGSTALYGAFGAAAPVTIIQARPRHIYHEQSAAILTEQSAAMFRETTAGSVTE
jgi:hypothetical protein